MELGNLSMSSSSRSSNGENDDANRSGMLLDLEALNCPICCDALTSAIFQCDNGHLACSTCCNKLRNKCPSCDLPVGHIRCRAMEKVIRAVTVPCPNAKLGCKLHFSYGKDMTHEKECVFGLCSCPAKNCNYGGSYKNLYSHFKTHRNEKGYNYFRFLAGESPNVYFEFPEKNSVFMKEYEAGLLFAFQCFTEPHGVYVTMSCIAPSAPEIGEFSCRISTVVEKYNMTFDFPKVKRVRKLSFETPKDDFMLVPYYFLRGRQSLKLRICLRKLKLG